MDITFHDIIEEINFFGLAILIFFLFQVLSLFSFKNKWKTPIIVLSLIVGCIVSLLFFFSSFSVQAGYGPFSTPWVAFDLRILIYLLSLPLSFIFAWRANTHKFKSGFYAGTLYLFVYFALSTVALYVININHILLKGCNEIEICVYNRPGEWLRDWLVDPSPPPVSYLQTIYLAMPMFSSVYGGLGVIVSTGLSLIGAKFGERINNSKTD